MAILYFVALNALGHVAFVGALSFFWDWHDLLRVDILNCMGAGMMLAAPLVAPRGGRPQIALALIIAAVFVALGPVIGGAFDGLADWRALFWVARQASAEARAMNPNSLAARLRSCFEAPSVVCGIA